MSTKGFNAYLDEQIRLVTEKSKMTSMRPATLTMMCPKASC